MTEENAKRVALAIRVLFQQAKLRDRLYGVEVSLGNEDAAKDYAFQAESMRFTAAVLTDMIEE
jgi:hypothetical protein